VPFTSGTRLLGERCIEATILLPAFSCYGLFKHALRQMKPVMYILECVDGSYYAGSTVDLERRLQEHNNFRGANYTKKAHPVKLVYFEEYERIGEAFYREKQIQGWSHAKKKALVEGRHEKLPGLSKKKFKRCVEK
jgi:putative endonuclease